MEQRFLHRGVTLAFGALLLAAPLPQRAWAEPGASLEQQVSGDRYVVRISGGAAASEQTLRDRAILRAAELTVEKGGDWFEVVPRSTGPRAIQDTDFGVDYSVSRKCSARNGCLVKATPLAGDTGAAPILEQSIEILIGSGETLEGGKAYVARDVIARIGGALG